MLVKNNNLFMVYRFLLLSDEVDNFSREIEIASDATFLQLHNAILESVGYDKNQITSFFVCSENWEKQQEITLIDMGSSSEEDMYLMEETQLDEFLEDVGQRLLYIYDNMTERAFFIELQAVSPSRNLSEPACVSRKGKAPQQLMDIDNFAEKQKIDFDTDFYGNDEYDPDELDEEGYGNMSFDENGNELY